MDELLEENLALSDRDNSSRSAQDPATPPYQHDGDKVQDGSFLPESLSPRDGVNPTQAFPDAASVHAFAEKSGPSDLAPFVLSTLDRAIRLQEYTEGFAFFGACTPFLPHLLPEDLLAIRVRLAWLHVCAGKPADAMPLLGELIQSLKHSAYRLLLADAVRCEGSALLMLSRLNEAVDSLNAALHLYQWELQDLAGALRARNLLAIAHKRRGKWAVAIDTYERGVAISEEHGFKAQLGQFCTNLGVLMLKTGAIATADALLNKAAAAYADSETGSRMDVDRRLAQSIIERLRGNLESAQKSVRSILHWAIESSALRIQILSHEYLGDIHLDEGRADIALKHFSRALRLSREKYPDSDLVCEAQRRRAEAFVQMGDLGRASKAAGEALRVSTKIEDPYEIALAHRARALAMDARVDVKRALKSYARCEQGLRELGEKFELSRTLLHIARIRMELGEYSAGAQMADEARRHFETMGLDNWVEKAREVILTGASRPQAAGSAGARASDDCPPPHQFGLITQDPRMIGQFRNLAKVARSDLPVILQGESGTGKELFARALHDISPRRDRPFIAVNCGAIPREMQESEFFGHARGAFTGAVADKTGLLEAAHGGTLFLDEIGEMTPAAQVKLLRVIETNELTRVGEVRPRKIDVRYVAATNVDLDKACASGQFRRDLFFRLEGIRLRIPPLRERRSDIPPLIEHFLQSLGAERNCRITVGPSLLNLLTAYDWPGNVRELRNRIARAIALTDDGAELSPADFDFGPELDLLLPGTSVDADMEEIERRRMLDALEKVDWNKTAAALMLNISRTTFTSRMERLGIPLRRQRPPVAGK